MQKRVDLEACKIGVGVQIKGCIEQLACRQLGAGRVLAFVKSLPLCVTSRQCHGFDHLCPGLCHRTLCCTSVGRGLEQALAPFLCRQIRRQFAVLSLEPEDPLFGPGLQLRCLLFIFDLVFDQSSL